MIEFIWRRVARFLARPAVADWLIRRAMRTPYSHLPGYMQRYWLLNAYEGNRWHIKWLPSVRIHHILRQDTDPHMHNHPWTFRSVVLKGGYIEARPWSQANEYKRSVVSRPAGSTYKLGADEFHRIMCVSQGGAWTLFVTWRYQHTWGFKTSTGVVPWREYLARKDVQR